MALPDPRTEGSNNPGATNVLRIGGKKAAALVLISDVLKGTVAVFIAKIFGIEGFMLGFIAFAVFLGHLFPIFFKFQGGKGVATALGGILVLSPMLAIVVALIWLITARLTRYSSLAALISALLTPFLALFITKPAYFLPLLFMSAFLIWRHRTNMLRLLNGTENKIKS